MLKYEDIIAANSGFFAMQTAFVLIEGILEKKILSIL